MSEHLQGHTTSADWLPHGVFEELDDLRAEQGRLRSQVAAELDALAALDAKYRAEDAGHAEALRQAHRDGSPHSLLDKRTPADGREAERRAIEERLWAGVHVFADYADGVIATIREHEDGWLAELHARLAPAREKRERAQQLLAEAQAEEFRLYKLGKWLMVTADDQPLGRQPAPTTEPVPTQLSRDVFRDAFQRPWEQRKPWNGTQSKAIA